MIAGDGQHVWLFLQQNRQRGVEIFNRLFLGAEISVLTGLVGVFVMDEEEVKVIVFPELALELLGDGRRSFDFLHADELRQAFVHRINRQCRGF